MCGASYGGVIWDERRLAKTNCPVHKIHIYQKKWRTVAPLKGVCRDSLTLSSLYRMSTTLEPYTPKKTLQWSKSVTVILTWKPRLWSICWVIRVKTRYRVLNMNLFSGSGVRMGVSRRESSIIANEHLCSMHTLYSVLNLHVSLLSVPPGLFCSFGFPITCRSNCIALDSSLRCLSANTLYSAYVSHLSALFIVYYCYLETIWLPQVFSSLFSKY